MEFLDEATRILFFTGKGGVGKTSVACAAAIRLADTGRRVLLVSTDPASNLDEVLGVELATQPREILAVPGLSALNLDPEVAAAEYRERAVAPYRGVLPSAAIASMEEQLSGSCTLEIAAFDEFVRLLGDSSVTARFDHIVFDTAPTGHTLRLLSLPSAWTGFMDRSTTGTSCLGPLSGLQEQRRLYRQAVEALCDGSTTSLVLVSRAERTALEEAARTSAELADVGMSRQHLVINGFFEASDAADTLAGALERRGREALAAMPAGLARLPRTVLPLQPGSVVGVDAVRRLARGERRSDEELELQSAGTDWDPRLLPGLDALLEDLSGAERGVILVTGKGGVGKTTVAAAVAIALAERGHDVHLTTTDPAAHLEATLCGDVRSRLTVSRIDPVAETRRYSAEVMSTAGSGLDDRGRALLEEDLRSPCTEEIAVFRAFADRVAEGASRFVVLDTAPTGHTVLLLDSTLAHHREVSRQSTAPPAAVRELLPRLRDPRFTRVLVVTLPEATPVQEAADLQRDLRRAGIEPFAWVVNQVLAPWKVRDPTLRARRADQRRFVDEVLRRHATRAVFVGRRVDPPVGGAGLLAVAESSMVPVENPAES